MAGRDPNTPQAITDLLVQAAAARQWKARGKAWTYGWCVEDYRRSPTAAIAVPGGRVQFKSAGLQAYEAAMSDLLGLPAARRWDADELWGVVAEQLALLPDVSPDDLQPLVAEAIVSILGSSDSLVAFALANTAWKNEALAVGDAVIGRVDGGWIEAVAGAARHRPQLTPVMSPPSWLDPGSDAVAFAAWLPFRGSKAVDAAEGLFDDLVATALLLQRDPGALGLWSLRGDSHRPGIRGLRIHRPAFQHLRDPRIQDELAAQIVSASPNGARVEHHWFGEDPFPLDQLLDANARNLVPAIIAARDPIHRRVRTAARWHARFHWSADPADAMLALGVAFDALLAEPGGSPGRVLVERFALLEPDAAKRADEAVRIRRIYEARSSVAHGGASRQLDDVDFVRDAAAALRGAARRMLGLAAASSMTSEKEIAATFEALRWGTLSPDGVSRQA